MISLRSMAAFALAVAVARDANAVGAVLSTANDPATVVEARFALALSRAQTTRWASLRVERFPGAMAWVLPVRPGARVDEVTDAWFEALEVATAPRVVGASCGSDAAPPDVHLERSTQHEPTTAALHVTPVDDVAALRAFAAEWALDLPLETADRFEALATRGFSFVALVYGATADRTITRTVRVTDDSFPAVPLFLTSGPASQSAVRVAAFLVAESRTRLGGDAEMEIDPAAISFSDGGTTNYDDVLFADLLARGGRSWVVEASDHALLFDGVRGPGSAGTSAPLVPTYFERARAYGDETGDPDLAFAGLDPSTAWITRVAGVVPAREFGDDLAVTMTANAPKSPFLEPRASPACVAPVDAGLPPPMPPPGPPGGPPPGSTTGTGTGEDTIDRPGAPPSSSIVVESEGSCSCSPGAGDDTSSEGGCDGSSDSNDSSDDGCDGSTDSSKDSSHDGCSGDSTHDSNKDGGGCDSSGSSSGSDEKCAVARHKRRGRSHTSVFGFALAAAALSVRRLTRRR
jgi:hypothetical protein